MSFISWSVTSLLRCSTYGVGSEVAGQVLISIGDNADRLKSEAAFALPLGPPNPRQRRPNSSSPAQPRRRASAQRPLRSRSRPHATRRSHPRIRRETNPRRASQARNHPLSQALRCPRDLQHTQAGDATKKPGNCLDSKSIDPSQGAVRFGCQCAETTPIWLGGRPSCVCARKRPRSGLVLVNLP